MIRNLPWAPALGAQSISHWTTREVPYDFLNNILSSLLYCKNTVYSYIHIYILYSNTICVKDYIMGKASGQQ